MRATTARLWFSRAADGFLVVLDSVRPEDLDRPGLGVWDVRGLLGHASRAFTTIETYLDAPTDGLAGLAGTVGYYRSGQSALADPDAVAQRGRIAGEELGEDPVERFREVASRVRTRLGAVSDSTRLATPLGVLVLGDYLPTRAFELTVHGIDLARAIGADVPQGLVIAARDALQLAIELAGPDGAPDLLLTLTGRQQLTEGFSVV